MPERALPPLPPAGRPAWRVAIDERINRWGLHDRTVPALAILAALAVAVTATATVVSARERPAPAAVVPAGAPPESDTARPTTTAAAVLVVDVAGAVVSPGMLRLPAGSRVADAIRGAGGVTADADIRQVNQARPLADGEQVLVPRRGEVLPPTAPGPKPGAPRGPVDLNLATADELDALPGVGPSTAAAIVEWRTRHGRFRSVEDLLEVPGIGPAKLETLRPLVTV